MLYLEYQDGKEMIIDGNTVGYAVHTPVQTINTRKPSKLQQIILSGQFKTLDNPKVIEAFAKVPEICKKATEEAKQRHTNELELLKLDNRRY